MDNTENSIRELVYARVAVPLSLHCVVNLESHIDHETTLRFLYSCNSTVVTLLDESSCKTQEIGTIDRFIARKCA